MSVSIHRHVNIGMPHQVLQRLWLHTSLRLITAISMSANVRRDFRHLHFKDAVVPIHRMLEPVLPMKRHFQHPTLIPKKESDITIHHNLRKISWSVSRIA